LVIETQHALVIQLVGASPEIQKHAATVSELSRHACVVSCRVVSCRVVSCRVVSCRVVSCRVKKRCT
jgi:hypothetical protein